MVYCRMNGGSLMELPVYDYQYIYVYIYVYNYTYNSHAAGSSAPPRMLGGPALATGMYMHTDGD